MARHRKTRLLSETPISIREHTNAFDQRMEGMLAKPAGYFGSDSHGLHHENLPQGNVEVGAVKSLGIVVGK